MEPIKGFEESYAITKHGQVWSYPKIAKLGRKHNGIWLKSTKITIGYIYVILTKNGKRKGKYIHRLVAEAFIPNPENKREVNHKNGIKIDNRIENLEWVSPHENMIHAHGNGLIPRSKLQGVNRPNSKLDDKKVKQIREIF